MRKGRIYQAANIKSSSSIAPVDADEADYQIILIVEFDGRPPKMTYYDKLHRMGIRTRGGNKEEESPLIRRASMTRDVPKAVVVQEGVFLCRNYDIAKELSELARAYGARVSVGGYLMKAEFAMTESDLGVYGEFTAKMGKRGRPRADQKGRYVVTCMLEGVSHEFDLEGEPVQCPECGSYRIHYRIGKKASYYHDKVFDKDLFRYWQRTRFTQSEGGDIRFEVPNIVAKDDPEATAPRETPLQDMDKPVFVNAAEFIKKVCKADPMNELILYDAAYALSNIGETDRLNERYALVGRFGGDKYLLFASDEGYDPIDICIIHRDFTKYL